MDTMYICECCGEAFEPTCHKIRQIYCSEACRIKYNNAKRYAPPGNACMKCGAALEQSGQRGKNRKFCGDACRIVYHVKKAAEKKRMERQTLRICPNCGREFVPMWEKGGLPRYCSDECRVKMVEGISQGHTRREGAKQHRGIKKQPLVLEEWDKRIWIAIVERATVLRDGRIVFKFRNGRELEVER